MTNLDYALQYARMGLVVFPLAPRTKRPMTENGVHDATSLEPKIREWWTKYPDAGIGLAARGRDVGDPCFLEFDQKPTLKDWARNEGQPLPETRVHRSGGKGAPHFLWTHTEKSLELGNCDGKTNGREWFSFRADGRYIVAPPSVHPDNGKPYTVFADVEPMPIPDWVVERIRVNGVRDKDFAKGLRPVHEDFEFDHFLDWIPYEVVDEDGYWYGFRECPVAGRRHKGQGVRGCALYYDGETLGFKCMAAECPSNVDRNPGQGGASFLVSFLSKENGAFDGVIWPEREDQLGAIDADEAEKAIFGGESEPPKFPPITDGGVCTNDKCKQYREEASKLCRDCAKGDKDISDAEKILEQWGSQGSAAAPAKEDEPKKEKEEPKKRRRGLYRIPETAMYGFLSDFAKTLGAPLDLAYPAAICIFAGQGIGKAGGVRSNLFGCLIGPIGTGKTRTIDRALESLEYEFTFQIKRRYPGSEHGLMLILDGKKPKDMQPLDYGMTKPYLLVQDEFRNTFAKSNIDNSALPFAFNDLFYHDEYSTESQKGGMICRPNLSIIGGLTAQNPEEFAEVFGKSTTTGLYDRMIFGVAPIKWEWEDEWVAVPVQRKPKNVHIPTEAFEMKKAWVKEKPQSRGRLGELALRVAVVTASANHDVGVTPEGMRAAIEFMEWQEAIRGKFSPSEQDDKDGKCQEAIERVLRTVGDADGWVEWREAKLKGNLYRHTASRLNRIFKGMSDGGMVEEETYEAETKGGKTTRKKSGRVRLVDELRMV
jgi:hypothetical protein